MMAATGYYLFVSFSPGSTRAPATENAASEMLRLTAQFCVSIRDELLTSQRSGG